EGDQVDILELMDIRGGKIMHHRIYWGWFGTQMLIRSAAR
ncbi:MAG: nuclear transport factor 2 family protein, partial [Kingella sp. (in: b-proteobacteria)]